MKEINSEKHRRNVKYDTGIYPVEFNDYSFEYCVNKSFLLINAQYYYKKSHNNFMSLIDIYKDIDYVYLLKKLEKKQKEYNMVSLDNDNVMKFKDEIDKKIGTPIINNTILETPPRGSKKYKQKRFK